MRADRYYGEVLRDTHQDIELARAKGNFTAVAALRRRAQDSREQLDAALAAQAEVATTVADPYSGVADDEITELLVDAVATLPEGVLVRLQTAIDKRRGTAPTLTVLDGGTAQGGST